MIRLRILFVMGALCAPLAAAGMLGVPPAHAANSAGEAAKAAKADRKAKAKADAANEEKIKGTAKTVAKASGGKSLSGACPPICGSKRRGPPPPPPPLPAVTGKASGPQGDTWESVAKLPNMSGAWLYDMFPAQVTADSQEVVPLKPPFIAKMEHQHALSRAGGDLPAAAYHCMPRGVPEIMELVTRAYEFLITPKLITIIPQNNEVRFVYMDGRAAPANVKKSWNGFSVGHWEDGMLVIDTKDIRPGTDMFYGFPGGSEQHVVERVKRISETKLQLDTTLEDPTALTKPYTFTRTFTHTPFPVSEEICLQNNRDLSPQGKQQFDLTPPPGISLK